MVKTPTYVPVVTLGERLEIYGLFTLAILRQRARSARYCCCNFLNLNDACYERLSHFMRNLVN